MYSGVIRRRNFVGTDGVPYRIVGFGKRIGLSDSRRGDGNFRPLPFRFIRLVFKFKDTISFESCKCLEINIRLFMRNRIVYVFVLRTAESVERKRVCRLRKAGSFERKSETRLFWGEDFDEPTVILTVLCVCDSDRSGASFVGTGMNLSGRSVVGRIAVG